MAAEQDGSEDLVRRGMPLVHHVVASMRSRVPLHVHVDDLASAAMLGLVQAARGFDPDRGVPFEAYASTRMRGAVRDELRSADNASRALRAKARSLQSASDRLGVGLAEAAAAAGLSLEEAREVVRDIEHSTVVHYDALVNPDHGGSVLPADHRTPETSILDRERKGYLRDAVAMLPERLRAVVVGYFFEERPMAELANELGVSESRVSHMRAEGLSLIREAMTANLDGEAAAPLNSRPPGVAARRRAAYCTAVASASDLWGRLEPTAVPALEV